MKASVAWLFFLGACGGPPKEEAPPPKADASPEAPASKESSAAGPTAVLAGTIWRLVELGGKPAPGEQDGKSPTLQLGTDGNRASGFAGCNRMSGTWEVRGDSLRLGPFALTRMACFKGMDLEQAYVDALQETRTFRLSAQGLELFGERGPLARLEAQ
jgi:heat shock protein HslJ